MSGLWTPRASTSPRRGPGGAAGRAPGAGAAEREPTPEEIEAAARAARAPRRDAGRRRDRQPRDRDLAARARAPRRRHPARRAGPPPAPEPRGGRARDRRAGRARRRPRRPARRARGDAARRAAPRPRCSSSRSPTPPAARLDARCVSRELVEPVELTGRFVRLEPVALEHVPALAAAAAEDRATYGWTPVPDGEAEFARTSSRCSPSAPPAAGSRSRRSGSTSTAGTRRRIDVVPRSAALAGRRRPARRHRDRRDLARGLGAAHRGRTARRSCSMLDARVRRATACTGWCSTPTPATSARAPRSPGSARPSRACCTASATAWRARRATPRRSRSPRATGPTYAPRLDGDRRLIGSTISAAA